MDMFLGSMVCLPIQFIGSKLVVGQARNVLVESIPPFQQFTLNPLNFYEWSIVERITNKINFFFQFWRINENSRRRNVEEGPFEHA